MVPNNLPTPGEVVLEKSKKVDIGTLRWYLVWGRQHPAGRGRPGSQAPLHQGADHTSDSGDGSSLPHEPSYPITAQKWQYKFNLSILHPQPMQRLEKIERESAG